VASVAAREPLHYAASLCRAQRDLVVELERLHAERPFTGKLTEDVDRLLPVCEVDRDRLLRYWAGGIDTRDDYECRAVLRPYVEFLRLAHVAPDRIHSRGGCPFCGGAPVVSSRGEVAGVDGIVRRLHCGLCGNEWIFDRISCPSCFESMPEKLPVYQTESHPAVRIEACDTCGRYVKSIDVTRDTSGIPEIDDLASIAFDLWAAEEGYTRLEPGLGGL
jgi:hypothetical protein